MITGRAVARLVYKLPFFCSKLRGPFELVTACNLRADVDELFFAWQTYSGNGLNFKQLSNFTQ